LYLFYFSGGACVHFKYSISNYIFYRRLQVSWTTQVVIHLSSFQRTIHLTTGFFSSEEVERCQKWSHNVTQQVDLAFNIFFMVYYFIRVSIFVLNINITWLYISLWGRGGGSRLAYSFLPLHSLYVITLYIERRKTPDSMSFSA